MGIGVCSVVIVCWFWLVLNSVYWVIMVLLFMILLVLLMTARSWFPVKVIAARHDTGRFTLNISLSKVYLPWHYGYCQLFSVLWWWCRCLCDIGITICSVGEADRQGLWRVCFIHRIYARVRHDRHNQRFPAITYSVLFGFHIECQFWDFWLPVRVVYQGKGHCESKKFRRGQNPVA